MEQKQITASQLLREFETYKNMLVSGKVKTLVVPVENENKIVLRLEGKKSSAENIIRELRKISKPFKVKRVDLFANLKRPKF